MCVIMIKEKNKKISEEMLKSGYNANPDGAGFATARDGEIIVRKGFTTFDAFLQAWQEEVATEIAAVAHFRIHTGAPSL